MKKSIIYFLVIVIGVVGTYIFSQKSYDSKSSVKSDEKTTEKTNVVIGNSRYVEYSKEVLEKTSGRRVLFFYASWCPTCRPSDASFKENISKIPEDMVVIRVNYNDPETDQEEKDLAKKYGITYQHTFVQIDTESNVVTKWNGGQIDELLTNIK